MSRTPIPILALIGGIGCGKSAVAAWLHEHVRASIVDADAVGHAVLQRQDVRDRLVDAFGPSILTPSHLTPSHLTQSHLTQSHLTRGQIDRSAVARLVFGESPAHAAARQTLEAIVHPVMRLDFEAAFQTARDSAGCRLIVFDAAVLLEAGWRDAVDVVAFLEVPFAERLRRVASRGWNEQQLRQREASQWPLEQKRAAADVVIDNAGPVEAAGRQLEVWLRENG